MYLYAYIYRHTRYIYANPQLWNRAAETTIPPNQSMVLGLSCSKDKTYIYIFKVFKEIKIPKF